MTVRRMTVLIVAVLALAACSGGGGATADSVPAGASEAAGLSAADGAADEDAAVSVSGVSAGAGAKSAAGDDGAVEAPNPDPLPEAPATRPGDRIIKEGTISIEVEQDGFDRAFFAVVAAARRYGGDVIGSSTRTAENGDTFGSVTVRVPVENFEDLLVGVRGVGEVRTEDVDSQDVSAEYTDLESRLRHLQAQERFYLGLFDDAESVDDAISVQQQLEGIQAQIEKIQGRKNVLDDRTTFSTLTVELFEPEAGGSLPTDPEQRNERPTLARYWNTARDAFVNVVGAMLVAFLFLLPLLVPGAVLAALWLSYRRTRRPASNRSDEQTDEREVVAADR